MTRLRVAMRMLVMATIVVASASDALAQRSKPHVLVIATGGTISNTDGGDDKRRTGEQLVAGIPALRDVAEVSVEQFSNVASSEVTVEMLRRLATRIRAATRGANAVDGVVVTHGTDTMEETAYFLDLTVGGCAPVVVTGAMRNAVSVGADGPANLMNAIRVAAAADARGRGTMVLMNDVIFDAHDVTKLNTTRTDAFGAPWLGPVGITDFDSVAFHRRPRLRAHASTSGACAPPAFDVATLPALPRVEVIDSYIDADSVMIDAAIAAGAKGLVLAGVGRGGATPGQGRALRHAVERGVYVAISSRTGSGRTGDPREDALEGWKPGRGAVFEAGDLNPQKARLLLMLALAKGHDAREIMEAMRRN